VLLLVGRNLFECLQFISFSV